LRLELHIERDGGLGRDLDLGRERREPVLGDDDLAAAAENAQRPRQRARPRGLVIDRNGRPALAHAQRDRTRLASELGLPLGRELFLAPQKRRATLREQIVVGVGGLGDPTELVEGVGDTRLGRRRSLGGVGPLVGRERLVPLSGAAQRVALDHRLLCDGRLRERRGHTHEGSEREAEDERARREREADP